MSSREEHVLLMYLTLLSYFYSPHRGPAISATTDCNEEVHAYPPGCQIQQEVGREYELCRNLSDECAYQ